MRLFIAEKPSLATEIAKGLGKITKKNGYFEIENSTDIVTWQYGHLLQQKNPEEYDERYKYWKLEDLPIIPLEWKLKVTPNCKQQFDIIKKLIGQASTIVHAGDPDREGQLLIDEVLNYVGNTKPVQRILLNALDEKSVKAALHSLRSNDDFVGLKNSALARARADWLIGMNLSRAYTIIAQKAGYQHVLKIGRVKTPTMALVVRREHDIKDFKSVNHYQVQINWSHSNGIIASLWQPSDIVSLDPENRLLDKNIAINLLNKIKTVSGYSPAAVSKLEEVEKKEAQRLPYSLSALQIDAGKRYGYDPQLVLDTMQQLYEKKLTTYPRSDCDFLPENQLSDSQTILANLFKIEGLTEFVSGASLSIRSRAWNDKKISAHHAIIPTTVPCAFDTLSDVQRDLYFMVAQAYIAQFFPIHIYQATKIWIECSNEIFTATGKTIIQSGWKDIYKTNKINENDKDKVLPEVCQGETLKFINGEVKDKVTIPPKRFTASTLLAAMKEISKYVKNPDLKMKLKSVSGIGTEATRATIIDELTKVDKTSKQSFLKFDKKFLIPTETAEMMVEILPDEVTYPDTTAIWEESLENIVQDKISFTSFLEKQKIFLQDAIAAAKETTIKTPKDRVICPACGSVLIRRKSSKGSGYWWGCSNYPNCKAMYPDKNGKPDITPPISCPGCKKGNLRKRKGSKGDFWGCSNYPNCKATYPDKKGKPDLKV